MIQRTALCCRCFTLPLSPDELWENYTHWIVLGYRDHIHDKLPPPKDGFDRGEIEGIEWLVTHLRYIGLRPTTFANYSQPINKSELIHFYTCDLLNPRTGLCTSYQNRHRMCASYRNCEYTDTCESLHCLCHPASDLIRQYQQDILDPKFLIKAPLKVTVK